MSIWWPEGWREWWGGFVRGPFLFDDSAVLGFVCLLGVSDLVLWTQDSKCHPRFMYINGRDTMEDWVEGVRGSIWWWSQHRQRNTFGAKRRVQHSLVSMPLSKASNLEINALFSEPSFFDHLPYLCFQLSEYALSLCYQCRSCTLAISRVNSI